MSLIQALTLLGLLLIIVGSIFYMISIFMVRYYDRKLYQLNERLKQDQKWRDKYER